METKRDEEWQLCANLTRDEFILLSSIFKSEIRRKIIISILNGCFFPHQIQKSTNIRFSAISSNLKYLEKRDIVKCQNPKDQKGKIYTLSEKAMSLIDVIREWNKTIDEQGKFR